MQVNGKELNINLLSVSFSERFENALKTLKEGADHIKADSLAESLRQQIDCVKAFVDNVFSPGTYHSLGLDPDDLSVHYDLVDHIIEEVDLQRQKAVTRFDKYRPNRAARRAK